MSMFHNNLKIAKEVIKNNSKVNKNPLLSVVVVTYQHAKYIR